MVRRKQSQYKYTEIKMELAINVEDAIEDIKEEIGIEGIIEIIDDPEKILETVLTKDYLEEAFEIMEGVDRKKLLELAKAFVEEEMNE